MRSHERWEYLRRGPRDLWDLIVHGRHRFTFDFMPMEVCGLSLRARLNKIRSGLNLLYRNAMPWAMPVHMQIELTNYCNLRCPICPTGHGDLARKPCAMDVEIFARLMAEVGPYLLTVSLWAWGEPLLHPRLGDVLEIARRYPVRTLLSTNGQNLDDPAVQDALRRHPPAYLIVAVDGLSDATNTQYRKGAKLDRIWKGVRALADWKREVASRWPVLHFRFIAMKHNQHEIPQIRGVASEHGFDMMSIRGLSIIDSPDEKDHRALLPDDPELRPYAYASGERLRRDDFICHYPFTFPTVLADGTVVACDQDYNGTQPFGAISAERSFKDVWRGKVAGRVRATIRDNAQAYSFCRNCPLADRPTSSCSLAGYALRPFAPG